MRRLLPWLALLLLPGAARAEDALLLDEWSETWQLGEKVAWEHLQLWSSGEGQDLRYVLRHESWAPLAEGQVHETSRSVCDARGRLLEATREQESPLGARRGSVGPAEGGGLRWEVTVAGREPSRGVLAEEVCEPRLITRLIARGKLPVGPHQLKRFSSYSAKPWSISAERGEDGVRIKSEEGDLVVLDGEGRLIRETLGEMVAGTRTPASAEQAADPTRRTPCPETAGWDAGARRLTAASLGLSLTHPGRGWLLRQQVQGKRAGMIGLLYADRFGLVAIPFPVAPAADEAGRQSLGDTLVRQSAKNREKVQFLSAEPVEYLGRPAIHFTLTAEEAAERQQGSAWLLPAAGGAGVLVMALAPTELGEGAKELLEAALGGLALVEGEPVPTGSQSLTLPDLGLSLRIPADWTPGKKGKEWRAPNNMAMLRLDLIPQLPPGGKPALLGDLAQRFEGGFSDIELHQEERPLAGQPCSWLVLEGKSKDPEGLALPTHIRCGVVDRPTGGYVLVLAMAVRSAVDPSALDEVLASLEWLR